MSDDYPDDMDAATKAHIESDLFHYGAAHIEVDGDDYVRIDPAGVSLSIEDGLEPHAETALSRTEDSIEFSFTIDLEGDMVRCPRCDLPNPVPPGDLLTLLSRGPLPCRLCGYPLL